MTKTVTIAAEDMADEVFTRQLARAASEATHAAHNTCDWTNDPTEHARRRQLLLDVVADAWDREVAHESQH